MSVVDLAIEERAAGRPLTGSFARDDQLQMGIEQVVARVEKNFSKLTSFSEDMRARGRYSSRRDPRMRAWRGPRYGRANRGRRRLFGAPPEARAVTAVSSPQGCTHRCTGVACRPSPPLAGEEPTSGALAEVSRLERFGEAKPLGTLEAPSKGRHYTG